MASSMDPCHFQGIGGGGDFCVVSAFGGNNTDGTYCWPLVIKDVEANGQSMAAMFEKEIPHLWHFVPLYQNALKNFAVGRKYLIGITKDDGTRGNVQNVEAEYLQACDGRFDQPTLPRVEWFRYSAWRRLVSESFDPVAFGMLIAEERAFRVGLHKKGDTLFYIGRSRDLADGRKITYGQEGRVIGPARGSTHVGKGLDMKFPGNEGTLEVSLEELSSCKPGPLPGGHRPRDVLYFTGTSHDFDSGHKLTYGQEGRVLGPATLSGHIGGLKIQFPGNKGWIDCHLTSLSSSKPGPLPGGHHPRDVLYFSGTSRDVDSGDKLTYGQEGRVLGPATLSEYIGGLKMKFPRGTVDCHLSELSLFRSSALRHRARMPARASAWSSQQWGTSQTSSWRP